MPAFQTLTIPSCPYKGDSYLLWNAEDPLTGAASERIAVSYAPDGNPAYYSIQFVFSADPGAFTYDIQESDTDADADFVKLGTSVTAVDSNFVVRVDLTTPVTANFLRVKATLQNANSVTVTAKITRQ